YHAYFIFLFRFFFSSRRRHTRFSRDWSSDVCSSDLAPLREILDALKSTYCGTIGAEYMHIVDSAQRRWFQQRLESVRGKPQHSAESRRHLLERLTAAEGLEKYLGTKYPGTKRVGVEGGESLSPMLDEIIQRSGSYGVAEVVLGMAHRGRLNVLV